MSRMYTGDIEGKFWVGVQNSDDATFFGGQTYEPNYINYEFSKEDLPTIEKGVKECRKKVGKNKEKLDAFFAKLVCIGMRISSKQGLKIFRHCWSGTLGYF
jgi:hypothetical protein